MKLRKFLCALCAAALLLSTLPAAWAAEAPAFTDAKDIQHPEAVTALVKLGVMSGKTDGSFDPAGTVSRGECAKMMTLILTGGKGLALASVSETPSIFPDVKGHWAEPYIEFCAKKGMAFPREDGNFDPNGSVTLFELLRMAEIALGRGAEEFTKATYWIAMTHSMALDRSLFTDLDDFQGKAITDHPVTRDEAAQVLYNALNATPEAPAGSSAGFYEDVKRPDGTPSTLLYECFGLSSWEKLDAWAEASKPKPSADPIQFTDAFQIAHWEAVAALCKLGVVNGADDGAFHPTDTVTRAEAAKLITLIMNGGADYNTGVKAEPSFSDTRGHWAEGYIEYCADLAIISGRGDGSFDPEGSVTALELVKMAESALGYDPAAYRLTGSLWALKADELARRLGLFTGLDAVSTAAPLTRDNTAQILYNALKATPKIVKPIPQPGGSVQWEFADAPHSFLKERFDLDEVGDLPVQPK